MAQKLQWLKFRRSFPVIYPLLLSVQFIIILKWSWRKWPDVIVDFGRELYIPWRIVSGEILYRDISHFFGPFSHYFNALFFYLFGSSYTTLIFVNIALSILLIAILYRLVSRSCDHFTAFVCSSVVITVFLASEYYYCGNYNFISPYAHEATHGLILSIVMIYLLGTFFSRFSLRYIIAAGFLFGLVFLTKFEPIIASTATVGIFFVLLAKIGKSPGEIARMVVAFIASTMLPVAAFFLYFSFQLPVKEALHAVIAAWDGLGSAQNMIGSKFYADIMGLDFPYLNGAKALIEFIVVVAYLFCVVMISKFFDKYKKKKGVVIICVSILCVMLSLVFFADVYKIGRSLPIVTILIIGLLVWFCFFSPGIEYTKRIGYWRMILFGVFSLFMLAKMFLNCRLYHYGFYLGLPAVVIATAAVMYYSPRWLKLKPVAGLLYRTIASLAVAVFIVLFIHLSDFFYKQKTFLIGTGEDAFLTFAPHLMMQTGPIDEALRWINANIDKKETLVVIPEGVMLNFLTKRANPTRFVNFMVPELAFFREDTILSSFRKNNPDYFVIIDKKYNEYGVGEFGSNGYGEKISNWINDNYQSVYVLNFMVKNKRMFFIIIFKKKNRISP
ncbi:MAG: glycosyltransferase family 39 protein [Chitinispirillaceae bacterium]|nr:glycosyltransferase family 39 protein [Chitinispirillaceae bacterium]